MTLPGFNSVTTSALVLTSCLLLSGCSALSDTEGKPEEGSTAGPKLEPAANAAPSILERAERLASDDEFLINAVNTVGRRCMESKGYEWPTKSATSFSPREVLSIPRVTVAEARQSGYFEEEPQAGEAKTNAVSSKQETVAYKGPSGAERAYATAPDGSRTSSSKEGCLGKANAKVYGSVKNSIVVSSFGTDLVIEAGNAVAVDDSFDQLKKNWANCMSGKDLGQYESPSGMSRKVGDLPQDRQREIAITDAKCRESAQTGQKLDELLGRYLTAAFEKYAGTVQAITSRRDEARKHAREVLQNG